MLETFYFQKSKIMCDQIFLYHFKIEIGKQVPQYHSIKELVLWYFKATVKPVLSDAVLSGHPVLSSQ